MDEVVALRLLDVFSFFCLGFVCFGFGGMFWVSFLTLFYPALFPLVWAVWFLWCIWCASFSFGRFSFSITLFLRVSWILVIAMGNGRWDLGDASTFGFGYGGVYGLGLCLGHGNV